jgi:hypothetical protein
MDQGGCKCDDRLEDRHYGDDINLENRFQETSVNIRIGLGDTGLDSSDLGLARVTYCRASSPGPFARL